VAARSKAWVSCRSFARTVSSNLAGVGCLVSVVFRQAEVAASGRSRVQRNPTVCGVFECVIVKFRKLGGPDPWGGGGGGVVPQQK